MKTKYTRLAALVAIALSQPLIAQEDDQEIEKITVTAQKRVQSIQDVPVTITAYNGDFLEQLGITELDVLSEITPGLVIQEQSPNNPGFVIRGITSDSGSSQIAPRVSVYYNGVDVSRSRGSYFELFDIERIEVVKGPQATLFGTAASVGALSVITAKPQEEFEAGVTLQAGNFSAKTLRGFLTGGNSKVQGRFAFSYRERDGFIDNIAGQPGSQTAGGFDQDDLHAIDRIAFRPSLRFTPNDSLTIDLIYSYEEDDDSGTSFKNGLLAPTGGDTSPFTFAELSGSPFSQEVFGKPDLGIEREVEDLNLTIEWAINENLTFTSISAGRSFESLEVFDADGTQAFFLEFAEDAEGDQFSQEVRVIHTGEKLTSIVGASYFTEDGNQSVPFSTEESIFLNCLGLLGSGLPCIDDNGSVNLLTPVLTQGAAQILPYQAEFANFGDNDALSIFADFTYQVNDKLELTAGIRFVTEDRTSGFRASAPNAVLAGAPLLPVVDTGGQILEASDDFSGVLPRFNALYSLNKETNLYLTVSKGRRSDVLDVSSTLDGNGNVIADVTRVPEEEILNYEVGVKGTGLERKVNYAFSVFYQDYSDFQVNLQDDAGNFFTANAGSATNFGVESDVRAIIGSNFELFANIAYIEAEIDDDSNNGDLAGNRFRLQPEFTASAGVFYNKPLSSTLSLNASLVYTYRSDVFFEPENAPIAGLDISEDEISLVNARIGIGSINQGWNVNLFANNLFDREYLVDAGNTGGAFGNPTFVAGPPRFYGIEVTKKFGQF